MRLTRAELEALNAIIGHELSGPSELTEVLAEEDDGERKVERFYSDLESARKKIGWRLAGMRK